MLGLYINLYKFSKNLQFCLFLKGDVGAPLVAKCLVFDCLVTAGIGSFISGNGCENSDPKGYTRVDAYEGWISDKIANN